jgi:hypothetical protein
MSIRMVRPILLKRGRNRTVRPKTFKSEESANTWAKANGLKDYSLEDLNMPSSKTRKIRIVE